MEFARDNYGTILLNQIGFSINIKPENMQYTIIECNYIIKLAEEQKCSLKETPVEVCHK